MKLTKDTIAKLELPAGATEQIVWDDDISGFGVRLRPHSATFIFRYRHGARQPRITLGKVGAITVLQARAEAAKLYARVRLGEDPAGDRADARERASETFALALRPYLLHKQAQLRRSSFAAVDRHLSKHGKPLHRLELAKAAERRRVAALLAEVASASGPVEANSMKGSLSGFFLWCLGQGLLEGTDPTVGIVNFVTNGARSHVPTDAEMVQVLRALEPGDYGDIVLLLTLTLCRLSEIANLSWDEVDFTAGLIRLPAARTRMNVARDVPMSAPVRRILLARQQQADRSRALVFGRGQGGFSDFSGAKRKLDKRAGVVGWTHHDLRRFGSTTMNHEGLAPPHIVDLCLGHAVLRYVTEQGQVLPGQPVERRYNWSSYAEQVRVAFEKWGERVMGLISGERPPAGVLPLRRRQGT
jgi:integrase